MWACSTTVGGGSKESSDNPHQNRVLSSCSDSTRPLQVMTSWRGQLLGGVGEILGVESCAPPKANFTERVE